MIFSDLLELQRALDNGAVEVTAKIAVRLTEWVKNAETGWQAPFKMDPHHAAWQLVTPVGGRMTVRTTGALATAGVRERRR